MISVAKMFINKFHNEPSAVRIGFVLSCLLSFLSCGCVNLYTRCPFTDKKIERVYQSTREAYSLSIIISWPQIMSDDPGKNGFMVENLITIPLGCIGMCDTACEAVMDTVFLPADFLISESMTSPLCEHCEKE